MTDPIDTNVIESLGKDLNKVLASSNSLDTSEPPCGSAPSAAPVAAATTTTTTSAASAESAMHHLNESFQMQKAFSATAERLSASLDRLVLLQDRINLAEASLAGEREAERALARHMDRGEQLATQFAQRFGAVKAERARLRRLDIAARTAPTATTSGVAMRDLVTRSKLNNHKAASHLYGAVYDSALVQRSAHLAQRPLPLYTLPELEAELEALRTWFDRAVTQLVRSRRVRTLARNPFNPTLKQSPKHLPRLEQYFCRAASWFAPGGLKYDETRQLVRPTNYTYDPGVNLSLIALRTALCACLQATDIRLQEDLVLLNVQSPLTESFFLSSAPLRMCTRESVSIKNSRFAALDDALCTLDSAKNAWAYPAAVLTLPNRVRTPRRQYTETLRQKFAKQLTSEGNPMVRSLTVTRTHGVRVALTDRVHLARIAELGPTALGPDQPDAAVVCTHAGTYCCIECRLELADDERSRRPLNRRGKRSLEPAPEQKTTKPTKESARSLQPARPDRRTIERLHFIPTYRQPSYLRPRTLADFPFTA
ncbi:hypothetical protein D0Z00_002290 [Geotrichum galactomycetum]|uniref:Uncharacterized protein n=1 Tax=Geotrichum galactomycetum TaxID=27317 RepID=A0ACB6V4L3_9ASCO|nr:hypothetical protein D0Z00_002290 [Geotrichum candidum]